MPLTNLLISEHSILVRADKTLRGRKKTGDCLSWKLECRFSGEENANNGMWEAENPHVSTCDVVYNVHSTQHYNALQRQITQIKQRNFSVLHHVLLSDHTMQQRATTGLHFPMLCLYPTLFLSDIRTSSHCLVNPWPRESVQGIIRFDRKRRPSSELIIYDLRKDVLP